MYNVQWKTKSCPENWWKHLIITNHLTSVCNCCLGFNVVHCMWEFIRLNNDTTSVSHCTHQYVWYRENNSFGTTHHVLLQFSLQRYTHYPCESILPWHPCPVYLILHTPHLLALAWPTSIGWPGLHSVSPVPGHTRPLAYTAPPTTPTRTCPLLSGWCCINLQSITRYSSVEVNCTIGCHYI